MLITNDTAKHYGWRNISEWRKHWGQRLDILNTRKYKLLTPAVLLQLERCADDATRHVLLGIQKPTDGRKPAQRSSSFDDIVAEARHR